MTPESPSFPYSEIQIRKMYAGEDGLKKNFLKESIRSNGLPTPDLLDIGGKMTDLLALRNTPDCIRLEIKNLTENRIKE